MSLESFTRSGMTVDLRTVLPVDGMPGDEQREAIVVPDLYREEVERFAACILNNSDPPIPGEEGLKNQRVLDAAMQRVRVGT
jgi:predicted dehydrogenase